MQVRKYLTTAEVKQRFGISSSVTLHNWRKKRGFPEPISGRYYSIELLEQWEVEQAQPKPQIVVE